MKKALTISILAASVFAMVSCTEAQVDQSLSEAQRLKQKYLPGRQSAVNKLCANGTSLLKLEKINNPSQTIKEQKSTLQTTIITEQNAFQRRGWGAFTFSTECPGEQFIGGALDTLIKKAI